MYLISKVRDRKIYQIWIPKSTKIKNSKLRRICPHNGKIAKTIDEQGITLFSQKKNTDLFFGRF